MPDAERPPLTVDTSAKNQLQSSLAPISGRPLSPGTPNGFEILLVTPMGPYRLPSYVHYLERTKEYAEWISRKQTSAEDPLPPEPQRRRFSFFHKENKLTKPLPLKVEETSQSVANFMDSVGMKEAVRTKIITPSRLTRLKDTTKVLVNPLLSRNSKSQIKSPSGVKTVVSGRHFPTGTKLVMLGGETNSRASESGESE